MEERLMTAQAAPEQRSRVRRAPSGGAGAAGRTARGGTAEAAAGKDACPEEILPHPLTEAEAEASRAAYGVNQLSRRRRRSFARQFLANLGDPVIRILLCALGANLLFAFKGSDWFETGGIALAVFLATLISTLSEYGSEAAFEQLSEECARTLCRVRRTVRSAGEETREIPVSQLVVGDLVPLGAGEMIPADGVLLSGALTVDQSAMTGESREVEKRPTGRGRRGGRVSLSAARTPSDADALFRGCVILAGQGEMLVTRVGDATFLGKISDEVQADTRESPLRLRLTKLAKQISRLGYVAAALVAVVYLIGSFLPEGERDPAVILAQLRDLPYLWNKLFHAATLGLTVLVVAVPEGLPMMIAVVLSSNIKRMVKDQVLVRKPVGIEAAGSMDLLFTDKTGTLTEGRLSVGGVLTGEGVRAESLTALSVTAPGLARRVAVSCMVNTQSRPGRAAEEERGGEKTKSFGQGKLQPRAVPSLRALGGNATDRALMDAALPMLLDPAGKGDALSALPEAVSLLPFDSARKYSAALLREGERVRLLVKGAPERLMPFLSSCLSAAGERMPFPRSTFAARIDALTREGGRVILLCEGEGNAASFTQDKLTRGDFGELTLLCALLLRDQIRREAPEAVRTLRQAGVHVVMMTGDNKETARAIAQSCGILGGGVREVLDSRELEDMSDAEVRERLPSIGVIARALPTDKSRLMRLAQEADSVVGMTGDGINDAPALKLADIGFAMGSGTQVAKDAGDVIIMDNNLASIVKAVLYGRTVFTSIRKFITLQLTMNLCAVGVSMIAPFLGVDAPVTVVQMLWINLIMDALGGLAFAGEAPRRDCLKERPKKRSEPILNRYMIHEMLFLGTYTVCLCLAFLKLPFFTSHIRTAGDDIYLLTAFFALFIFASVFNCFNARTDRLRLTSGLARNPAFLGIMAAVLVIQILFVYLGGAVLRTAPLTISELGFTSLCALSVFPAELIRKVIWRLGGREGGY